MKTIKLAILLVASFALAASRATAVTVVEAQTNSTMTLPGTRGADGSLYQRYKNTSPLQDDVVHILGAQSYLLSIKTAVPNDSGTYRLYITEPDATNSALSDVFVLWVVSGYITNVAGTSLQLAGQPVANASYQWLKDDVPLDSESNPSATNAMLRIAATSLNDAGRYVLRATPTANGVEIEAVYFITVVEPLFPPHITGFVLLTTGNDITFSVTATGGQLTYQWFWQGQPIPGATGPTLEYHNAFLTAPAGYYSVVVSNAAGQASSPPPGLLFTKTVPSGNYEGILYGPNGIAVDSSGYFQMNVSGKKHRFSGTATFGLRTLRFTGEFGDDHHSDVKLSDGTQIHLQLIATNDTAEVSGTVDTGDLNLSLLGFQNSTPRRIHFPQRANTRSPFWIQTFTRWLDCSPMALDTPCSP